MQLGMPEAWKSTRIAVIVLICRLLLSLRQVEHKRNVRVMLCLRVAEERFRTSSDGRCVKNIQRWIFTGTPDDSWPTADGRMKSSLASPPCGAKKGELFSFSSMCLCEEASLLFMEKMHHSAFNAFPIFFPMHFNNSFQVFLCFRDVAPLKLTYPPKIDASKMIHFLL